MKHPRLLLSSPQHADLAARVAALNPRITSGTISWKRFPDGFPNLFIEDVDGLRRSHVSFLACFDKPETVFEQVSMMYHLANLRPRTLRFLLPYYPTGTMERADHEGQCPTAATLADMISAVAPAGPGPVPLFIWDIHALPIRSFFGKHISPRFKTGTKLLKEELETEAKQGREWSIAFPDEGSYKRFKVMFPEEGSDRNYPFIICRKERKGAEREVSIIEGEVKGRNVVIVDDLVHSGITTLQCKKALLEGGAALVASYVTHGVFENDAWKRFVDEGFYKVWTTDSCPTFKDLKDTSPFHTLSLERSIVNAILSP